MNKAVRLALEQAEMRERARQEKRPGIRKRPFKRLIPDLPKEELEAIVAQENEIVPQEAQPQDGATTFTFSQVQSMMAQMMQMNREAMVEFAKELKKPSDEEAAKQAEAKQRREKLIASMIESAKVETAERKRAQDSCNHKKPNGIINFGGQVHGDRVRLICKTCFKELVNRPATPDDMQQGPLELLIENQRMGLNA